MKPITVRRWALWGGIAAVALIALALALRPAPVEVDVEATTRLRATRVCNASMTKGDSA